MDVVVPSDDLFSDTDPQRDILEEEQFESGWTRANMGHAVLSPHQPPEGHSGGGLDTRAGQNRTSSTSDEHNGEL